LTPERPARTSGKPPADKPLVLAVGGDEVVLEGIVQTLVASGFRVRHSADAADAADAAAEEAPLLMLVSSRLDGRLAELMRLPRQARGAVVLWHSSRERRAVMAPWLQRGVLAELELPLERARLLALSRFVLDRYVEAGRGENGDSHSHEARG